jgi:hypothetical protein
MTSYLRVYIFETKLPVSFGSPEVIQTYYIDPFTCCNNDERDPHDFINLIDNGSLISTGIWKTREEMKEFRELLEEWKVKLHKCDYDVANHSGCQSSCIRRGDQKCSW